jgi:hypothetical protein
MRRKELSCHYLSETFGQAEQRLFSARLRVANYPIITALDCVLGLLHEDECRKNMS